MLSGMVRTCSLRAPQFHGTRLRGPATLIPRLPASRLPGFPVPGSTVHGSAPPVPWVPGPLVPRLPTPPAPRPSHLDSSVPGFSVTWLPGPWFHGIRLLQLRGPTTLIPRLPASRLPGPPVLQTPGYPAHGSAAPDFSPHPAMPDVSAPGSRATPRCESPGEESRTPAAYGPAVRRRSPPRPRATTRSGSGCPVPEGCGGCGRCRR